MACSHKTLPRRTPGRNTPATPSSRGIRPQVLGRTDLERDLSLHDDVLFSLLTICQLVIDIAGDLGARRGDHFKTTRKRCATSFAIRASGPNWSELERLPGFRNMLVHEYVALDLDRTVEAMDRLAPVTEFVEMVRGCSPPKVLDARQSKSLAPAADGSLGNSGRHGRSAMRCSGFACEGRALASSESRDVAEDARDGDRPKSGTERERLRAGVDHVQRVGSGPRPRSACS